ncbi:hypothetical protein AC578_4079 [Pseudocercospora eumusae]|uniref:Uncharacterized protein n=1 Tax=Pseudocercospora eumusae TaxID=321146 RepID=A0A139HDI2_9PEZI|nr:hypothetical protein AC578_4079 [Pseudocercospora eumusae]
MRPPLRIAILECDEPIGRTKEKYGSYGNLFQELLSNGASKFAEEEEQEEQKAPAPPPKLEISNFDIVNHPDVYPDLQNFDALLLTGSRYNSFDDDGWILKLVGSRIG